MFLVNFLWILQILFILLKYIHLSNQMVVMSIGVVVLIENKSDSRYLMLKQDRGEYDAGFHYAPPAGTLDKDLDECPKDTAVREVEEETGLDIDKDDLYELFETDASYGVDKLIWYKIKFKVTEDQIELNHESNGFSFLSKEQALEEELLEDTRNAFNRLEE